MAGVRAGFDGRTILERAGETLFGPLGATARLVWEVLKRTSIDGDIPRSVFAFTHVLREDPRRAGLLYAGTENGVWLSFDDGASWHSMPRWQRS